MASIGAAGLPQAQQSYEQRVIGGQDGHYVLDKFDGIYSKKSQDISTSYKWRYIFQTEGLEPQLPMYFRPLIGVLTTSPHLYRSALRDDRLPSGPYPNTPKKSHWRFNQKNTAINHGDRSSSLRII